MTEPRHKRPRVTPRNSINPAEEAATPYNTLHSLSKVAKQPSTPTISSTTPHALSARPTRTPATTNRTPGTARARRRLAPTTPHAIRAQFERRNAIPLSARKKTDTRRETPRDALRILSRLLSKTTEPAEPSPAEQAPRRSYVRGIDDDSDDEATRNPPRMSLPGMEEDDSLLEKPRFSTYMDVDEDEDDDEITMRSIEAARERLSRGSFGRLSGIGLGDLTGHGLDITVLGEEGEETVAFTVDGETVRVPLEEMGPQETVDLHTLISAATRRSRVSDVDEGEPEEETEPTFRFRIPERVRDPTIMEDEEVDAIARAKYSQPENEDENEGNDNDALDAALQASALQSFEDYDDDNFDDAPDLQDNEPLEDGRQDDYETDLAILARLRRSSLSPQPLLNAVQPSTDQNGPRQRRQKSSKISEHGHPYPSLPPSVLKRLSTSYLRQLSSSGKISADTLAAINTATDWFFEQVSQDLGAYAAHAGRKRIEESDVVTLMKRQRALGEKDNIFSLAQKGLPRELLHEIRMVPPKVKGRKRKLEVVEEETDEDDGSGNDGEEK